MELGSIPDDDNLFRFCTHPVSFKGKVFSTAKFLLIQPQPDGSFLASLVWERFVPTVGHVHCAGCRLARGMNQNKLNAGKYKAGNKSVYCGAYRVRAGAIRALPAEVSAVEFADVVHRTESGELAHTDLRIKLYPGPDSNIEGTKTQILDRLWNACCGPLRHICECDKEVIPHPSAALLNAPFGACSDTRSWLERWFSLIRYRVYDSLWRKILWRFSD